MNDNQTEDRIIEMYIHNLSVRALRSIEQHCKRQGADKFSCSMIEMKWLEDNFSYIDNFASAIERQQYAQGVHIEVYRGSSNAR
ncbi:hypothetical protein J1N35_044649 [Gossypium stocksii]|uniref:Uncharacterized protein n=1 Tax=Gossypium stocksii TaxID=47602 RepID=A0A9D3U9T1_9ROSI|nr:hypothetical protein J1N35_044649 [Gossypium stocksii]